MATLTNEQIEQKKQLLEVKVKQMKVIYNELVEAGAIALRSPLATEGSQELSDDELDGVAGGFLLDPLIKWINKMEKKYYPK
jgi:hypothetical protein